MKRIIALLLTSIMLMSLVLTGCGDKNKDKDKVNTGGDDGQVVDNNNDKEDPVVDNTPVNTEVTDDPSVKTINLWAFTDEVPNMVKKFKN